ncbi:uncharacterized protein LOC121867310 [Homarus americanus]|uniref:Putative DM4/DM12 family-like protein 18 n=1 Tax=Homarus americanus TaxID=6706 RepID=A0A8J5K6E2_HOMAM|nr:uncharacterized protein LOC121867310 [Homarus americanus]KAG7168543.1 putative DM4/DM12 family-like protein 18 [Homarus americanus]
MTAALPNLFTHPYLSIVNQLGVPINTDNDNDSVPTPRLLPYGAVSFIIILDALVQEYVKGRSYTDDQVSIYRSLEDKMTATYGLDGPACLLRFICDLQKFPIKDWTIVGEVITAVFTPREDGRGMLLDYREAQLAGQMEDPESCFVNYGYTCPFSVFNYFRELEDLERQDNLPLDDEEEAQELLLSPGDLELQADLTEDDGVFQQIV